jgi:hypothetical protein
MNDLKELRGYVDSLVFLLKEVERIDTLIFTINRAKHGHGEETRQASLEVQDLERQKAKLIESINKVRAKI